MERDTVSGCLPHKRNSLFPRGLYTVHICTSSTRLACLHHFFSAWNCMTLGWHLPLRSRTMDPLRQNDQFKVWRGTPTHGLKLRFHGCQSLALNIPNYISNAPGKPAKFNENLQFALGKAFTRPGFHPMSHPILGIHHL